LGPICGGNLNTVLAHGPFLTIVAQQSAMHNAVHYVKATADEDARDRIEVREQLLVGSRIERAKQHLRQFGLYARQLEGIHIAAENSKLDSGGSCSLHGSGDHVLSQIQSNVLIAAPMPLGEVRGQTGGEFEHRLHWHPGKPGDGFFKEINVMARIAEAERNFVILRKSVDIHVTNSPACGRRIPLRTSPDA